MSTTEIDQWLAYYTKLLRLQDWTIVVSLKRAHQLPNGDLGRARAVEEQRHCTIDMLDPCDFGDDWEPWCTDLESTLVHELLHVVFYALHFEAGTVANLVLEQGINAMAYALVVQRRAMVAAPPVGPVTNDRVWHYRPKPWDEVSCGEQRANEGATSTIEHVTCELCRIAVGGPGR